MYACMVATVKLLWPSNYNTSCWKNLFPRRDIVSFFALNKHTAAFDFIWNWSTSLLLLTLFLHDRCTVYNDYNNYYNFYLPKLALSRTNSSIVEDFLITLMIASQTSDPCYDKKYHSTTAIPIYMYMTECCKYMIIINYDHMQCYTYNSNLG